MMMNCDRASEPQFRYTHDNNAAFADGKLTKFTVVFWWDKG